MKTLLGAAFSPKVRINWKPSPDEGAMKICMRRLGIVSFAALMDMFTYLYALTDDAPSSVKLAAATFVAMRTVFALRNHYAAFRVESDLLRQVEAPKE